MKVYNCYVGHDLYNHKKGVELYSSRVAPSLKTMSMVVADLQNRLESGRCLWYCVDVLTLDPATGVCSHEQTYKSNKPKEKIILNPLAQAQEDQEQESGEMAFELAYPPPNITFGPLKKPKKLGDPTILPDTSTFTTTSFFPNEVL